MDKSLRQEKHKLFYKFLQIFLRNNSFFGVAHAVYLHRDRGGSPDAEQEQSHIGKSLLVKVCLSVEAKQVPGALKQPSCSSPAQRAARLQLWRG